MGKCIVIGLILFCSVLAGADEVNAGETQLENDSLKKELWYIGPRIGYSAFSGIVGLEMQYRHTAFSLGAPGNIGVKYYFQAPKHSWFIGGFFSKYDSTGDETKDGITYNESEYNEGGIGGGYRWRWGSGWDLSLSLGIAYGEEILTNSFVKRTATYIGVRPGLVFGYSF